jgi:hypothetical protein
MLFLLFLLLASMTLTACFNPVYNRLNVDGNNVPPFAVLDRKESEDTLFVSTHYKTEGSGEKDAKKMVADALYRMEESQFEGVVVKVTDEDNEVWYGVYVDEHYLNSKKYDGSVELEEEKQLIEYLQNIDPIYYPLIKFSSKPIIEKK